MKPATLFSPSVYRAALFLFILFLLFNRAYSQLTDSDQAKKAARGAVIKLQTAQTALGPLAIKSSSDTVKLNGVEDELSVVKEKIRIHNLNQVTYDPDKPKTPEVIAYEINAGKLNDSKSEITGRKIILETQLENIKAEKDSLNIEIRSHRGVLRVKSINVAQFFNSANCLQMPGEVATVAEWKSYLDCLFDGTPRNHVDFKDPDKPGDIKVSPNTDPNIIIPDNNPLEREKKLKEIKRMIDESNNNNKPNQPVVLPPPPGDNTNEKGGSLSDALKSLIYQVRNKIK